MLIRKSALLLLLAMGVQALPPGFEKRVWLADLPSAMTMTFAPDGRLFLSEQGKGIRIVKQGKLLPTPFTKVETWATFRESISGIALDPKFAANGYVYVYYLHPVNHRQKIDRFTASKANPDVSEEGSRVTLLEGIGPNNGHMGGAFFFGKDNMLYAGSGTGASQNLGDLGGKILRINPATYPNIIPADNPFVGRAGAREEIFALGFREPFTGAADTVTGAIHINDVGDTRREEVNLVKKGGNYGYPACEGPCDNATFENPIVSYDGTVGRCIAGGAFYYGNQFPAAYRGGYFYNDEQRGWTKFRAANGTVQDFDTGGGLLLDADVGPDGSLYLLKISGEALPWKGTVTRISYGPTGIPSAEIGTPDAPFGPERGVISERDPKPVRFHLGAAKAREAHLTVSDLGGRPIFKIGSRAPGRSLDWDLSGIAQPAGTYFYQLRVRSAGGAEIHKDGKLFLMN